MFPDFWLSSIDLRNVCPKRIAYEITACCWFGRIARYDYFDVGRGQKVITNSSRQAIDIIAQHWWLCYTKYFTPSGFVAARWILSSSRVRLFGREPLLRSVGGNLGGSKVGDVWVVRVVVVHIHGPFLLYWLPHMPTLWCFSMCEAFPSATGLSGCP